MKYIDPILEQNLVLNYVKKTWELPKKTTIKEFNKNINDAFLLGCRVAENNINQSIQFKIRDLIIKRERFLKIGFSEFIEQDGYHTLFYILHQMLKNIHLKKIQKISHPSDWAIIPLEDTDFINITPITYGYYKKLTYKQLKNEFIEDCELNYYTEDKNNISQFYIEKNIFNKKIENKLSVDFIQKLSLKSVLQQDFRKINHPCGVLLKTITDYAIDITEHNNSYAGSDFLDLLIVKDVYSINVPDIGQCSLIDKIFRVGFSKMPTYQLLTKEEIKLISSLQKKYDLMSTTKRKLIL